MTLKDRAYLEHILEAINNIEASIFKIKRQDFEIMKDVQDACIRRLEIIGEAVKNLSQEIKTKYPSITWKEIADARDRIIHAYFNVDLDVVWSIIIRDIPLLKRQIIEIKEAI